MKKRCFFLIVMVTAVMMMFVSCTDFFSTSWASWAARDPDKLVPAVTAGNVDELIAMAENNPDLSLAILKKIQAAAANAPDGDKQKLQGAALEAAINAGGLGQAILGAADKLTNIDTDIDGRKLVLDALNSMKNLDDSCLILSSILPDPSDTEAFDAFAASANTNDLVLAAALLMAGEAKQYTDPEDYVENVFDNKSPQSQNEILAVKMIEAVVARPDELSGSLENVLKGLNLI